MNGFLSFEVFSEKFYFLPGKKNALLKLQDDYDLNVNFILFCFWVGLSKKKLLSSDDILILTNFCADWHDLVVKKIRKLRKYLKKYNNKDVVSIREKIKKLELRAEYLEQEFLLYKFYKIYKKKKLIRNAENIPHKNFFLYLDFNRIDKKKCSDIIEIITNTESV